ncbi:IS30 family transposase [Sinorhizobium meliloti]
MKVCDRRALSSQMKLDTVSHLKIERSLANCSGRWKVDLHRELKRNTFHDAEFPEYSGYYNGIANDISKERRRRLRKLSRHPELRELSLSS